MFAKCSLAQLYRHAKNLGVSSVCRTEVLRERLEEAYTRLSLSCRIKRKRDDENKENEDPKLKHQKKIKKALARQEKSSRIIQRFFRQKKNAFANREDLYFEKFTQGPLFWHVVSENQIYRFIPIQLYKHFVTSGRFDNPYTRKEFNDYELWRLSRLLQKVNQEVFEDLDLRDAKRKIQQEHQEEKELNERITILETEVERSLYNIESVADDIILEEREDDEVREYVLNVIAVNQHEMITHLTHLFRTSILEGTYLFHYVLKWSQDICMDSGYPTWFRSAIKHTHTVLMHRLRVEMGMQLLLSELTDSTVLQQDLGNYLRDHSTSNSVIGDTTTAQVPLQPSSTIRRRNNRRTPLSQAQSSSHVSVSSQQGISNSSVQVSSASTQVSSNNPNFITLNTNTSEPVDEVDVSMTHHADDIALVFRLLS